MNSTSGNCIISQSGGPTSVINSTAYGCIREFMSRSEHGTVYAGLYGIEGILHNKIVNVSNIPDSKIETLKYMPSATFGSNRYRLQDYQDDDTEYIQLFELFKRLNIRYFFYIGGNDSMDTANKLFNYAALIGYEIYVCGVPKTIDNDLMLTDHCPGFGSAAKLVANTGMEVWMDINTYNKPSAMVMEVMGRDTGWIAASASVLKKAVPDMNLLTYLPEKPFNLQSFLEDVSQALQRNDKLLIVASEGLKDASGHYVAVSDSGYQADHFGHRQLGGIGEVLQSYVNSEIINSVKLTELGILQRCAMHCVSQTDLREAEMVGRDSVRYALAGNSGYMTTLIRNDSEKYQCTTGMASLADVCNRIKYVPSEWFDHRGQTLSSQVSSYMEPLIFDEGALYHFWGMDSTVELSAFRETISEGGM